MSVEEVLGAEAAVGLEAASVAAASGLFSSFLAVTVCLSVFTNTCGKYMRAHADCQAHRHAHMRIEGE